MRIENLPHLTDISENISISGAAGTAVTSDALAFGDSTLTRATATTTARPLPNGGSLSIGRGFAFAAGDITEANVTTAGEGDIVVGATHSTPDGSQPVAVAGGVVVAIDVPS